MATRAKPAVDVRPIVIRRVKKVVGGGHHGGAWKVAYADFVTAMMAFFMLLWLLANPDKDRLKGLAQYFSPSSASAKPGETIETVPSSKPGLGAQQMRAQASDPSRDGHPSSPTSYAQSKSGSAKVPDASVRVVAEELKLLLQPTSVPRADQQRIQMEQAREGLRVSLMDDDGHAMFRPGTATLNPYAAVLLGQIARKLATSSVQIAIEGHTDGQGGQSTSNWHLSADRALAARDALIAGGLTPDRFSEVVALAATQPVYPDQPLRPENRRITIVLLADSSPLPRDVSFRF
ncbi:OmpA family protein [Sphingomonas sp. KRR8]|uniref:flagellar motor protein MotB n=1 Tax=Sphingomonas sp. KRR8 TaxID=2942996 RepID=UPI002020F6F4|nr:flagellar motor protein MotB [Sphingomonas sp. KRR8]URD61917.1 OmpA family protein [Sphingomonas sp. KRR8]